MNRIIVIRRNRIWEQIYPKVHHKVKDQVGQIRNDIDSRVMEIRHCILRQILDLKPGKKLL